MRALVTGAAGFIGGHVVRALVEAGHQVRALHLPADPTDNLDGLPVERVAGDVLDREGLESASCECYRRVRDELVQAIGTDAAQSSVSV